MKTFFSFSASLLSLSLSSSPNISSEIPLLSTIASAPNKSRVFWKSASWTILASLNLRCSRVSFSNSSLNFFSLAFFSSEAFLCWALVNFLPCCFGLIFGAGFGLTGFGFGFSSSESSQDSLISSSDSTSSSSHWFLTAGNLMLSKSSFSFIYVIFIIICQNVYTEFKNENFEIFFY